MLCHRILVSILFLAGPAFAQGDCSTAFVLDPCGGDSVDLGPGTDGPTPCGAFPSRWAQMTPARSGPLVVTNTASTGRVAVYTGSCGALVLQQCDVPSVTFNAVEGTPYYFQLENFGASPAVHASVVSPNCAPNDASECLQAYSLDSCGGETVPFDTSNGENVLPTMDCQPVFPGQQWFEIVPVSTGTLNLSVSLGLGSDPNFLVGVFAGDCAHLDQILCLDENDLPTGFAVDAGTRYTIVVQRAFGGHVNGTLTVGALPGSPCGPCTDCDADTYDMSVDCDDGNSDVHPGAMEILGNGIDDDCDGTVDTCSDCDGDGYPVPLDCDDTDPNVHPGAAEIYGNGIDDDCDGTVDEPATFPRTRITVPPGTWGF